METRRRAVSGYSSKTDRHVARGYEETKVAGIEERWRTDVRLSLEVGNSFGHFRSFGGDGDVGGGDDERRLKPDRSEAGLSLRRRETHRACRACSETEHISTTSIPQ